MSGESFLSYIPPHSVQHKVSSIGRLLSSNFMGVRVLRHRGSFFCSQNGHIQTAWFWVPECAQDSWNDLKQLSQQTSFPVSKVSKLPRENFKFANLQNYKLQPMFYPVAAFQTQISSLLLHVVQKSSLLSLSSWSKSSSAISFAFFGLFLGLISSKLLFLPS